MALLEFTQNGIYCSQAAIYIDPWRPVRKALLTHGHSDHARFGHQHYLTTERALPVIKYRLGSIQADTVQFGEPVYINGVRISFHPAGHIIGSAQIRLEYKGEVWVVSGDYKTQPDGLALPFEPIRCHTFITECTFGLPVYKWESPSTVFQAINQWWQANKAAGKVSVISGYSLGKAQRIIHHLDTSIGKIYTHTAIENINEIIRAQGIDLPATHRVMEVKNRKDFIGNIVVAPPASFGTPWMKRFSPVSTGIASGWMALRGARRRRAVDRGFVLSDHIDWKGLNETVKATGAERLFVTHGYTDICKRWFTEQGYDTAIVRTAYEGELSEINEQEEGET